MLKRVDGGLRGTEKEALPWDLERGSMKDNESEKQGCSSPTSVS